jgi:CheY-like chemotaxis protein
VTLRSLETIRVLVVEDDDDSREMTRLALEAAGAVVTVAASAAEALSAIEAQLPDVVLSDISMPGQDGRTLLRRIRAVLKKKHARVPAVALTALGSRADREASRDAGFHYHLDKPVEPRKLVEVLSGVVRLTRG